MSEVALAAATKLIDTPSAMAVTELGMLLQLLLMDIHNWKLSVKPLLPPHMLVLNDNDGNSRSTDFELV